MYYLDVIVEKSRFLRPREQTHSIEPICEAINVLDEQVKMILEQGVNILREILWNTFVLVVVIG